MQTMQHSRRPLAAVTGASSTIGRALALQFAQHGYDLLAVAEDDGVAELAAEFADYGCQLTPLQLDLSTLEGVRAFVRTIESEFRPLDALAIHGGVCVSGEFARETSLGEELSLIELDVIGSVRLTKAVLPGMLQRRRGKVLLTSSEAALQGSAYEAVYAASKAFLLSFASSLHAELQGTGVTMTALLPGDAHHALGDEVSPSLLARRGFDAMMAGQALLTADPRLAALARSSSQSAQL
jgi:short-subunit dehydrogenase